MSLYALLSVPSTTTAPLLKKAYHRALLASHPDKHQGFSDAFIKLRKAWKILGDTEKREAYDKREITTSDEDSDNEDNRDRKGKRRKKYKEETEAEKMQRKQDLMEEIEKLKNEYVGKTE